MNNIRKRYKIWLVCALLFVVSTLFTAETCSYNNAVFEYVEANNGFNGVIRDISWSMLTGLAQLLDGMYEAITKLLTLDFLSEVPALKTLVDDMKPITWAVLTVGVIIFGISLLVLKDKIKISDGFTNFLLAMVFIVGMPLLVETLTTFKAAAVSDMNSQLSNVGGGGEGNTVGQALLKSITVDVEKTQNSGKVERLTKNPYKIKSSATFPQDEDPWKYKLTEGGSFKSIVTHPIFLKVYGMTSFEYSNWEKNIALGSKTSDDLLNAIRSSENCQYSENIRYLINKVDLNGDGVFSPDTDEYVYSSGTWGFSELNSEYNILIEAEKDNFQKNVASYLDNNAVALNPGLEIFGKNTGIGKEEIFRYQPNIVFGFLIIIISLVAMIFAGFKIAKMMFEIIFNQIIAPIALATDVNGSGRGKKALMNLFSSYVIFLIILFLMKIYLDITTWVAMADFNLGEEQFALIITLRLLIIGGSAMGLIDGPDLVTRLLGIDAGVKSGMGAIVGGAAAGRMAKGIVSAPGNAAKKIGGAAKSLHNMPNAFRQNAVQKANTASAYADLKASKKGGSGDVPSGGSSSDNSSDGVAMAAATAMNSSKNSSASSVGSAANTGGNSPTNANTSGGSTSGSAANSTRSVVQATPRAAANPVATNETQAGNGGGRTSATYRAKTPLPAPTPAPSRGSNSGSSGSSVISSPSAPPPPPPTPISNSSSVSIDAPSSSIDSSSPVSVAETSSPIMTNENSSPAPTGVSSAAAVLHQSSSPSPATASSATNSVPEQQIVHANPAMTKQAPVKNTTKKRGRK